MKQAALAFLPTLNQERLLKACLLSGAPAIEAWNAWRDEVAVEDLDYPSQRMLPLLYHNLKEMGVEHAQMQRYLSVYRYTWAQHQMNWQAAAATIGALEAARVPCMALKGMAMIPLYYANPALRPMADLDLMVPQESLDAAMRQLLRMGWSIDLSFISNDRWKPYMEVSHSLELADRQKRKLDLHVHLQHEFCDPGITRRLWDSSRVVSLHGKPVRTLSDTHHLLHACLHGARWNGVHPMRWIADSFLILRSSRIDWPELLCMARDYRMSLPLRDTLGYLRERFGCAVPDEVMAGLRQIPAGAEEQLEYHTLQRPMPYPFRAALCMRYRHYRRASAGKASLPGFVRYLCAWYGTPSLPALLAEVSRRVLSRFRAAVRINSA